MKVKELLEFIDDEESPRNYPNPLPSIEAGDPEFEKFDDAASEAERMMVYKYRSENGIGGNITGEEYGNILKQSRQKYGKITNIPIKKLIATEPFLDKNHLDKIMKGEATTPSDKLPNVYKVGNAYYIGDGNHRVVAAALQGNQTVKVLLLDVDKLKNSLTLPNK